MAKYLYIDDAPEADIRTFANALMGGAADQGLDLEISICQPPADFRMEDLLDQWKPDGVLIDIELEKAVDAASRPYPMTGTALAQNIRDLQNAQKIPEVPLIRLSQADVLRKWVGKDQTSLDLFDRYFDKAEVAALAGLFAETLVALERGYKKISAAKPLNMASFPDLLAVHPDYFHSNLSPALLLAFFQQADAPAHDLARFVSSALLDRDGPLIGEATLAARLGVDRAASGESWTALLAAIDEKEYRGIFAVGHDRRWWADGIADWWAQLAGGGRLLVNATGDERCEAIRQRLDLAGLTAVAEDADSPGPYYWTTCIASGKPLDPMNAYAITPDIRQREWHDIRYMCREEAFQHDRDPRFDENERARILEDRA